MIVQLRSSPQCVCFAMIFAITQMARGGDVLKADDTLVSGEIVAFDGENVTIQPSSDLTTRQMIPIADVVRIRTQTPISVSPPGASRGSVPFYSDPTPSRVDLNPTAPPGAVSLPLTWQLTLINGDVLSGNFRSWSGDKFVLELAQGRAILQIPIRQIREIWRLSPELVQKARALKVPPGNLDVAYVLKSPDIVAVQGEAAGIENLALGFTYEGQNRRINIDRLLGVVLVSTKSAATAPASAPSGIGAVFRFSNGDQLSGEWTGIKNGFVLLTTSWGQSILLPSPSVGSIEPRSGRVVYLSDLKPLRVEQTPYFDRVIPWRADHSLDGGPLRLGDGQQYSHGIAMHSRCVLDYDLAGQFQQFQARLGFEPLPSGSVVGRVAVRVLVDGLAKFEISDLRSDQPPQNLTVDLQNGKRLTLEVDFGQDEDVNDRIVWANSRLIRGG